MTVVLGDPKPFMAELQNAAGDNLDTGPNSINVQRVQVASIVASPYQPRTDQPTPEEIAEKAKDLYSNGQLSPIVGRWTLLGFELLDGELRWRAAQQLGWDELNADARDVDDKTAAKLALSYNAKRRGIKQIDEASHYRRLVEDFAYKESELAEEFGRSISTVQDMLRVAGLPDEVIALIRSGTFTYTHGVALSLLSNDKETILQFTARAVQGPWKADALEKEVRAYIEEKRKENEAEAAANAPKLALVPNEPTADDASTPVDTSADDVDSAEASSEPATEAVTDETAAEVSDESPATEPSTDEQPADEPKVLDVGEEVQWKAARGEKMLTGKVTQVGLALVWVRPDRPAQASEKTFKRDEAHTLLTRTSGVPVAPFPKAKETKEHGNGTSTQASTQTSSKPAKSTTSSATPAAVTPAPTTATPATPTRKAIDGMTATYAPTDDLFFCEDAGYPIATVLQSMKRLIALAQARSISVDEYLTALEED